MNLQTLTGGAGASLADGTVKVASLPVPSVSDRRDGKTLVLEQFQYVVWY